MRAALAAARRPARGGAGRQVDGLAPPPFAR